MDELHSSMEGGDLGERKRGSDEVRHKQEPCQQGLCMPKKARRA